MASNINNLNILTFIKDIYQSLKHIDNCFNSYKENIDARLSRVEDNQQNILDKLNILEQMLYKINSNTQQQVALDKNIEHELLEKMNTLNKNTAMDKLNLKLEELTFANILENNYTILDINETLAQQNTISTGDNLLSFSTSSSNDGIDVPLPLDASTNNLYNDEIIKKKETLENLLF
jgi:hypothetical protein